MNCIHHDERHRYSHSKRASMPPKKPAGAPSKSRELVTTGPKELIQKKSHGKRDENGLRPTTTRALILRNGKHGAMGTGELVISRISGREKLELLAGG